VQTLIVNQQQVPELLTMGECIDVMAATLTSLARGDAILPLRPTMALPQGGLLALMPSYLGDIQAAGVKVITVFPENEGTGYDPHQGAVLVFDAAHGALVALVDATAITAIRTAAVSAVATRLLARGDAGDLAILGSGTQARAHLEAMLHVRDVRRIRVWSRTAAHARTFAERESQRHGLTVEVMDTAREAVAGADLICTTTSAREPVLLGEWIAPGAHVNAVGNCLATCRELDTAAVVQARLFVDRRESALHEAGEFLLARQEGAVDETHIQGEIGEVLVGIVPGRQSPDEVTLFKSLGLAIEDLAAAHYVYRRAQATGKGSRVELGGRHHAAEG
jgi:alanine dehydrogenase